ncbi:hypothetical protein L325_08395 [Yersinia pestis 9]|uniref:hypothetical protein n=1 Tax=Yersinia pestis TaxID=632 RepID=UPI0003B30DBF|nr:hypothetical protein [Yersinia pestis]ERP83137.1 hypothetical protein L325_08395 [Yersinia pestis 9]
MMENKEMNLEIKKENSGKCYRNLEKGFIRMAIAVQGMSTGNHQAAYGEPP